MKPRVTVIAICWVIAYPLGESVASTDDKNFAVDSHLSVVNFDLSSVHQIQPGRFVITALTIDKPEIMRMRMAATREMHKFCLKPVGVYPVPSTMYGIGPPDLPVNKLTVAVSFDGAGAQRKTYKFVTWKYPYKVAATCHDEKCIDMVQDAEYVSCNPTQAENENDFLDWWKIEANGVTSLEVYDCDHGLSGTSFPEFGAEKAVMYPVRANTLGEDIYAQVCYKVFGRMPYLPN